MSSIVKVLKKAENKRYISIYQADPDKFMYGRILAFNENDTAVMLISPKGEFDGIVAVRTDSITRIEYGGMYEQRMSMLIDEKSLEQFVLPLDGEDIFGQLLEMSAKSRKVVSLELLDSGYDDITGVVESVDNGCVCVKLVDVYGVSDGNAIAALDDITQISCLGEKELAITKLM